MRNPSDKYKLIEYPFLKERSLESNDTAFFETLIAFLIKWQPGTEKNSFI